MSNKRTNIFCNVRTASGHVTAVALAATMALAVSPLAATPAAFADGFSGSAGSVTAGSDSIEYSVRAEDGHRYLAVQSVIQQVSDQAEQDAAEAAAEEAEAKKAKKVNKALKVADSLTGTPYMYGGSTPKGFDCSGFTMYCYKQAGIKLSHNAQDQYMQTKSVSTKKMKPGDLVFFGWGGYANHVGIYVGDGKYIHSPQTGEFVRVDKLSDRSNFMGATRPVK